MKQALPTYLLLSALVFGQKTAIDPGGWAKAKWGMKEAQIKIMFPQAALLDDPQTARLKADFPQAAIKVEKFLGIPSYAIETATYTVTFHFGTDGGLESVALDPKMEGPVDAVAHSAEIDLLDGLTNKYGKPTQANEERRESGHGFTRTWQWIFPTTSITLSWTAYEDTDYRHLDTTYLTYSHRRKSADL